MKAKIITGFAVALAMLLSFSSLVAIAGTMEEGDGYVTEFDAVWTNVPPTIDGVIDTNEWGNGNDTYIDVIYTVEDSDNYTDETVYIYFMNDADFVYFAFDFGYATNTNESDGVTAVWAIDINTDNDFEAGVDNEPWMLVMTNQTATMSAFSGANALYAGSFGASENIAEDHYMLEFAVPMYIFGDVTEFGFAFNSDMAEGNESFAYPIVDADLTDIMTDPIDSTDWAIITLAPVETAPLAEEDVAITYAMIMFGIGTIVFVILLVAHEETIYKWIAHGDDKYVYVAFAVGIIFLVLGFIQWMYDWVGMII